jgi:GDP-4-dehydro-6-deoxy-D-mannose reductase
MKRIFVTGAEGFVGGHLLPVLRATFPDAEILGLAGTRLDITDREAVFAGVKKWRPDACIHLAGIAAIGAALADPARAWAVNVFGAVNIAEAILAHAPACRLIFVSSAEVYGASFRSGTALDETATLAPMNLYAATKAAAEMALCAQAVAGLRLLRLRPFNHTGPGQTPAFVVPAFAQQIARIEAGEQPPVISVGALTPARDFLDVRDVCAAYAAALARFDALPNNTVFNIASGQPVQIADILRRLLALSDQKIEIHEDPAKLRPVEIPLAYGNAAAAARLLDWRPRHSLNETLSTVLEALRHGRA